MSQNINATYANATKHFKELTAQAFEANPDDIHRKRVPRLEKQGPEGTLIEIEWEPEDGFLFEDENALYRFPSIVRQTPNVTILPNLGLNFQTATLAYIPKTSGTELDRYMVRQRFDFLPTTNQKAYWQTRSINEITFGIKDSGKAIDRMEVEVDRKSLKLRHAINALKRTYGPPKSKKPKFKPNREPLLLNHPALMNLSPSRLRSGAITALSRAAFFGLHVMPENNAAVDYQFSIDFCRNSRPRILDDDWKIALDGHRFEGEFEAFGTYSPRKLTESERVEIIMSSLETITDQLKDALDSQNIRTIDTNMNKAEFARAQVDKAYANETLSGLERASADNIKAEDYSRPPQAIALTQLFDGNANQGLVAMPTPDEMRQYAGLDSLDLAA